MKNFLIWVKKSMATKWFAIILAVLAFSDTFLLVFPIDILLVTAVIAHGRSWLLTALIVALGNILSVLAFAYLSFNEFSWLLERFTEVFSNSDWQATEAFLQSYGTWGAFIGALTPFPFQVFLLLGAASKLDMLSLVVSISIGRLIKYILISWAAAHSPKLLRMFRIK